jgi:hypothetical protein
VTSWGAGGMLLLCAGGGPGRFELRACAGVEAGVRRVSAFGYDIAHAQLGRLTNLDGRAGFAWALGERLALTVDGDIGLALVRNRFTARLASGDEVMLWQPPPVAANVQIGLEFRLR